MKDLETDLHRIAELIEKWGSFSGLSWAEAKLRKTMYIMTDLQTLDDLCQGLDKHDRRIDRIVQTLQLSGIGAAEKALNQLQELQQKQKAEERERVEASMKWLELLQEHGPEEIAKAAQDTKQWNELRQELLKKGMSQHDTEASMNIVKNSLDTLEAPAEKVPSLAKPRIRPWEVRILCVDEYNASTYRLGLFIEAVANKTTVRSIVAQAYLECLRVWSANHTRGWLFANVDSAGCWLESVFLKDQQALVGAPLKPTSSLASNAALKALADQPRFTSFEKDAIFARLRTRKTRGVMGRDFYNFDYILCFENNVYDLLQKLAKCVEKGKYPSNARIFLIQGTKVDQDLDKTCSSIKMPIRKWLAEEFGWVPPDATNNSLGIKSGPWRTLQFLADVTYFKALKANHWKIKKELQSKYNCQIGCGPENWHNKRTLISIVGKKEDLAKIKGAIMALEV